MSTVGTGEVSAAPIGMAAAGVLAIGGLAVLGVGCAAYGVARAAVWCGKKVYEALERREKEIAGRRGAYCTSLLHKQAALNILLNQAICHGVPRAGSVAPAAGLAGAPDVAALVRQVEQELAARTTAAEVDQYLKDFEVDQRKLKRGLRARRRPAQARPSARATGADEVSMLRRRAEDALRAAEERLHREEAGARLNPDLGREVLEALRQAGQTVANARAKLEADPERAADLAAEAESALQKAHTDAWEKLQAQQQEWRKMAVGEISRLSAQLETLDDLLEDLDKIQMGAREEHPRRLLQLKTRLTEMEQELGHVLSLGQLETLVQRATRAVKEATRLREAVVNGYNDQQRWSAAETLAEIVGEMGYRSPGGNTVKPVQLGTHWQVDGRKDNRSVVLTLDPGFSLNYDARGFGDLERGREDPSCCVAEVEEIARRLGERGFSIDIEGIEPFQYPQAQRVRQMRQVLEEMSYEVQVVEEGGAVTINARHASMPEVSAVIQRTGAGTARRGGREQDVELFVQDQASAQPAPAAGEVEAESAGEKRAERLLRTGGS